MSTVTTSKYYSINPDTFVDWQLHELQNLCKSLHIRYNQCSKQHLIKLLTCWNRLPRQSSSTGRKACGNFACISVNKQETEVNKEKAEQDVGEKTVKQKAEKKTPALETRHKTISRVQFSFFNEVFVIPNRKAFRAQMPKSTPSLVPQ